MQPFDLLIFDCDGVLVDSEVIACRIAAEAIAALGYPIDHKTFLEQKSGRALEDVLEELDKTKGLDLVAQFDKEPHRKKVISALEKELVPSPHMKEIVAALKLPLCIASGSSVERNKIALTKVGLFPFFEGRIFCSHDVPKGKPAPDVYFYAAEKMRVAPARCLVVEDSAAGIEAAKAAGMTVFAFLGASHISPVLRAKAACAGPDLMFDDIRQLPELIEVFSGQGSGG